MGMDTDAPRRFQQVADGVPVTELSDLAAVTQPGVSRARARLKAEVAELIKRRGFFGYVKPRD